jgi:hypothetical protein
MCAHDGELMQGHVSTQRGPSTTQAAQHQNLINLSDDRPLVHYTPVCRMDRSQPQSAHVYSWLVLFTERVSAKVRFVRHVLP